MFIDWKTSHWYDVNTIQSNLTDSVQSIDKISITFLLRNRKIQPKIHKESQGIPSSQKNLKRTKVEDSHFLILKLTRKVQ